MRYGKYIIVSFIFILISVRNYGQDIHFSQFDFNPLFLNPALTGTMPTQYRVTLSHRSQWNSFTNAYKTISASVDHGREVFFLPSGRIGLGLAVLSDRAGDAGFGETSFYVPLSVQYPILRDKVQISIGGRAGMRQFSFDHQKLYWGTQFNGNYYDPELPSDELFANTSQTLIDFSAGIFVSWITNNAFKFMAGWSQNNLNAPVFTFSEDNLHKSRKTKQGFISCEIPVTYQLYVLPSIYFQQQEKNNELLPGAQLQFIPGNLFVQEFRIGLFLRNRDAVILRTSAIYKEVQIGLSYDITNSDLSTINNGRGAFELSLVYLFNIRRMIPSVTKKYCPDFI